MQFQSQLPLLNEAPPWLVQLLQEQYSPPEEGPLASSEEDLTEFLDSSIWQDFVKWIDDSIQVLQHQIEGAKNFPEVQKHLGHIECLRMVRVLPMAFINHIRQEKKHGEGTKEER